MNSDTCRGFQPPDPARLDTMRSAALRLGSGAARALILETCSPEEEDAALEVFGGSLGERVVSLQIPALLADRISISRAVLRCLFESEGGRWLSVLRGLVPRGRDAARWFENSTDLSPGGARRVAEALAGVGDFGAIGALVARSNPAPEHFNGAFYDPPPPPFGERDALALLVVMLERAASKAPLWFIIGGLEEMLGGCSPWGEPFGRGFARWWRAMLGVKGPVLVGTCWRGAMGELMGLDPGLARGRGEVSVLPAVDPKAVMQGIALSRGLGPVREDRGVWQAEGESGLVALVWPQEARDPAQAVVSVVGAVAESLRGVGGVEVIFPRWASGAVWAGSMRALSHAFPFLKWVAVSRCALLGWQSVASGESVG